MAAVAAALLLSGCCCRRGGGGGSSVESNGHDRQNSGCSIRVAGRWYDWGRGLSANVDAAVAAVQRRRDGAWRLEWRTGERAMARKEAGEQYGTTGRRQLRFTPQIGGAPKPRFIERERMRLKRATVAGHFKPAEMRKSRNDYELVACRSLHNVAQRRQRERARASCSRSGWQNTAQVMMMRVAEHSTSKGRAMRRDAN
jgi:hypothetical protein